MKRTDDGAFGNRVDAPFVSRPDPVDGRHVDDGAPAAFLHQFAGVCRHEEVTAYVDFNGLGKRSHVGIRDMAVIGVCRGIVDQNVQPAMLLPDVLKDCFDLLRVADVAGMGSRLAPFIPDTPGHYLAALLLAAGNNDMGALLRQQSCRRLADTPAGAGHQRSFTGQVKQVSEHNFFHGT